MSQSGTLKGIRQSEKMSYGRSTNRLTLAQRFDSKTDKFGTVLGNQSHHLVRRFFSTVVARAPGRDKVAWVRGHLSDVEFELWSKMSSADQIHSISVAQRVRTELPGDQTALIAGLLHDVGKTAVRSGLVVRVLAAVIKPIATQERLSRWASDGSFLSKVASFIDYPRIGADLLQSIGSDDFVVRWAAEHHLARHEWTVDKAKADVLARADHLAV